LSFVFPKTEWQVFHLGEYGADPYESAFPCLPQVQSGHTKTFPPRATLGPTDPDVDDTLSTANWQDLTGGQGISIINPSTDMGRTWWSTADTRDTDGWTNPPEVTQARPSAYSGNCNDFAQIGTSLYGLWGSDLHKWNPDARTWGAAQKDVGAVVGPGVAFNSNYYWPLGSGGLVSIAEASAGTLANPVILVGTAAPSDGDNDPAPTNVPKAWRLGVFRQQLWVVTTQEDGYHVARYTPSLDAWNWPYDNANQMFPALDPGIVPAQLIQWMDALGQNPALWLVTDTGCLRWNSDAPRWEETNLWNVPPHPNWGKCAKPFRPGEALWIASGGGDLTQYSANGVVVPASGPGGRGMGMPADKRGDIVSMATDLANLYVLLQGEAVIDTVDTTEDTEGADPIYLASGASTTSVIAYTGKGWHPLWEDNSVEGTPTEIVVAKSDKANGSKDFTAFWGVGEYAFSMPCRLTTYSAAQGRKAGIDRFATTSYIELGEFSAGALATKKLNSHMAVLLPYANETNYVEVEYQTDASDDWMLLGSANVSNERVVLPFGLSGDSLWAEGLAAYWIKPRLTLVGAGALVTPVVRFLSLAYMPLRQDATHAVFTIPLPVEVDERTGKTAAQIHDQLHDLIRDDIFLLLRFGTEAYRVVVSGMSHTEIAGEDFVGAIKLNVIQIPTGKTGLIGEVA
jgi:hypothetical protein